MTVRAVLLALTLVVAGCAEGASTPTTTAIAASTTPEPENVGEDFWRAIAEGSVDAAINLLARDSADVVHITEFLGAFSPGITGVACTGASELTCDLQIEDPLLASGEAHMDVAQGAIVELTLPPTILAALGDLSSWAEDNDRGRFKTECPQDGDDDLSPSNTCGAYLSQIAPNYLTAQTERFFSTLAEKDLIMVREFVGSPRQSLRTAEQLRNAFRFIALSNLVTPAASCVGDEGGVRVDVSCSLISAHPLLDGADLSWNGSIQGGVIVDGDVAPHEQETDGFIRLHDWALDHHPDSTESLCGVDQYPPTEIVSEYPYALNDRCGAHLSSLIGDYYADTQPEHPIAIVSRVPTTFNSGDLEGHLALFADDAVLFSFKGVDAIREFVSNEMKTGLVFTYHDYSITDGRVCVLVKPIGFQPTINLHLVIEGKIALIDDNVPRESCY